MPEEQEKLPKPQTDLPLPEKDLPLPEKKLTASAESNLASQVNDSEAENRRSQALEPDQAPPISQQDPPLQNHPNVNNDKPASKSPVLKFIMLGVLFVIGLALIGGAYFMGTQKSNQQAVSTSPSPTPDPTADWKTFSPPNQGFSIKYPANWTPLQNETLTRIFPPGISIKNGLGPDDSETPYISISHHESNPLDCRGDCPLFTNPEPIKVAGINATKYTGTDGQMATMCGCSYEKIILKNGNTYYLLELYGKPGKTPDYKPDSISEENKEIFDQILSTFNFTDFNSQSKSPNQTPSTIANGAHLESIKFTLPNGWTNKLNNGSLLLSPSNGGYLSIKVYDYDGKTGRREFYCKTTGYCLDSSRFTTTKIGNISGYKAESLDNSGGGSEYFGNKGNKFYIISTFNPPSPNEYDNNFQNVLNSLIF